MRNERFCISSLRQKWIVTYSIFSPFLPVVLALKKWTGKLYFYTMDREHHLSIPQTLAMVCWTNSVPLECLIISSKEQMKCWVPFLCIISSCVLLDFHIVLPDCKQAHLGSFLSLNKMLTFRDFHHWLMIMTKRHQVIISSSPHFTHKKHPLCVLHQGDSAAYYCWLL